MKAVSVSGRSSAGQHATLPTVSLMDISLDSIPNSFPVEGGPRSNPDCQVCSNRKVKRHQTAYMRCECCVPLCVEPCFHRYHTLLDYRIDCGPNLHPQDRLWAQSPPHKIDWAQSPPHKIDCGPNLHPQDRLWAQSSPHEIDWAQSPPTR